jgi:hypothetical protein
MTVTSYDNEPSGYGCSKDVYVYKDMAVRERRAALEPGTESIHDPLLKK